MFQEEEEDGDKHGGEQDEEEASSVLQTILHRAACQEMLAVRARQVLPAEILHEAALYVRQNVIGHRNLRKK